MYEARQNREKVSRILSTGNKRKRIHRGVNVSQLATIKIKYKNEIEATGQSGQSDETKRNMESIHGEKETFKTYFQKIVHPKDVYYYYYADVEGKRQLVKEIVEKNRTPFKCAEPNALSRLLVLMQNGGHVIDGTTFDYIIFPEGAKDYERGPIKYPCDVCKQWVRFGKKNLDIFGINFDSIPPKQY